MAAEAADQGDLRRLVFCADDYAQDAGVSAAICQLARQQRLTATSVMTLSPRWPADAAPLRELHGQLDVGLHLDFTSHFAQASGHGMPLLAAMRRAAWRGFDVQASMRIIERQLDAFEAVWQAPPDHVDGHQHVQQFKGIREALVQVLVRRYARHKPWLRISRQPPGQRDFKGRVMAWMGAHALQQQAEEAGLPCLHYLSGVYDFSGGQEAYARKMQAWLQSSPAGTVLMCHPGTGEAAPAQDGIAAARPWELAHLQSALMGRQLAQAGVVLARGSSLFKTA